MSLLSLDNTKDMASLLAFLLLFSLKSLPLMQVSCKVMRQPWGETCTSELGSKFQGSAKTTLVSWYKILKPQLRLERTVLTDALISSSRKTVRQRHPAELCPDS